MGVKRKAAGPAVAEEDISDIFRRHFEARFEPLADEPQSSRHDSDNEDDDDAADSDEDNEIDEEDEDGEWGGVSDEDDEEGFDDEDEDEDATPIIEVVDHSSSKTPETSTMSKKELKAFMSSRPPEQGSPSSKADDAKSSKSSKSLPEDAPSLLKQDLELRRLLAESHLLNPTYRGASSPFSSGPAAPKSFDEGRTRHKAIDMRIQALGSKGSILKQEKMPMNMRKGKEAAAAGREAKRRKEARENGIILERAATGKKQRQRTKERGLDGPGMGRFKGAQLTLNKRDVEQLQNSRDRFGRRSRR